MKFRTKFILVCTISVLLGVILNSGIDLVMVRVLGRETTGTVTNGLNGIYKQYLTNYIQIVAQKVNSNLSQTLSELSILGDITQKIIDNEKEFQPIIKTVAKTPFFKDNLKFGKNKKWKQNDASEPSVVSVWGHLLKDGKVKKDVQEHIDKTAILDLIMPSIQQKGAGSQWMYITGPDSKSYLRLTPYSDMASNFDRLYPGHNETDFWDFFFPGLVESWKGWTMNPSIRAKLDSEITLTPPYEDAAGSGIIISIFKPLWDKTRTKFQGAVAIDYSLGNIIDFIKDVRIAETGFAFLSRANGNVIGISKEGEKTLGLQNRKSGSGISILKRLLSNSKIPEFAALELPKQANEVIYTEVFPEGTKGYLVVMTQIKSLNYHTDAGIKPEPMTLGFVVPEKEIYAPLYKTQTEISNRTNQIFVGQIAVSILTLILISIGVFHLSNRLTRGLVSLSKGAKSIQEKDYDINIPIYTDDEIGQLTHTFNGMVTEIKNYTQNLEGLVKDRTKDLEQANEQITKLAEKLKEENLRLGAELDVAKKIQSMVLPKEDEFSAVKELDISGYMEPADEVGGDYYDVLLDNGSLKMGIGDVTGHGLESGIVMLMVQTATRTLQLAGVTDPERFYAIINALVFKNVERIRTDRNLTLSLIDYRDNKFFITGQHEDIILMRNNGELERIDTMELGIPVGLESDITDFLSHLTIDVESGDILVFHTDGITEAEDKNGKFYGFQRLCDVVQQNRSKNAHDLKDVIIKDVESHIGKYKVFDDITLLVIKKV